LTSSKATVEDLREQLLALEEERDAVGQKASARFDNAKEQLKDALTEEGINMLLAKPPECAAYLGRLLAAAVDGVLPTSAEDAVFADRVAQLKTPEFIDRLVESVLPMEMPYSLTSYMLIELQCLEDAEMRLKRRSTTEVGDEDASEGQMALSALMNYFSGVGDLLNARDDICEASVRMQECQLMVSNMQGAIEEEGNDAKALENDIEATRTKMGELRQKAAGLERELTKAKEEITAAEELSAAFEALERGWKSDMEKSSSDGRAIADRAMLTAAAYCYLAVVPQSARQTLFDEIKRVLDMKGSSADEASLMDCWTLWSPSCFFPSRQMPAWSYGLASRVAVVLDPNDVVGEMFEGSNVKIHYLHLLSEEDRQELQRLLVDVKDVTILVEQFVREDFEFIRSLTIPSTASVFFLMADVEEAPLWPPPPEAFFIDLSLTPEGAGMLLSSRLKAAPSRRATAGEDRGGLKRRLEKAKKETREFALKLCSGAVLKRTVVTAAANNVLDLEAQIAASEEIKAAKVNDGLHAEGNAAAAVAIALLSATTHLSHLTANQHVSFARYLNTAAVAVKGGEETALQNCFRLAALHHREENVPILKLLTCLFLDEGLSQEDKRAVLDALGKLNDLTREGVQEEEPLSTTIYLRNVVIGGTNLEEYLRSKDSAWRPWKETLGARPPEDPDVIPWVTLLLAVALKPRETAALSAAFVQRFHPKLSEWTTNALDLRGV